MKKNVVRNVIESFSGEETGTNKLNIERRKEKHVNNGYNGCVCVNAFVGDGNLLGWLALQCIETR